MKRGTRRTPLLLFLAFLSASPLLFPSATAQGDAEDAPDPIAGFSASPRRPEPGQEVTFSAVPASKAFSPCQPLQEYAWDLDGDGEFETVGQGIGGAFARRTYEAEGTYTVTLRVTDSCGQSAVASQVVPVEVFEEVALDFSVIFERQEAFLRAAGRVIYLSVVAILVGLPLGVAVGLLRLSRIGPVRWVAAAYVEFIRGTPLLVQIFIVWLALPQIHPALKFSTLTAGLIALIINTSAYLAEIVRAGIQAIPSGQREAALGLGLSRWQTMRFIILPQALRLVIPPLTNEFIILIKDTSLLSVIGVIELVYVATVISQRTFRIAEPFIAIAIIYFVMTYSLSLLLQYLERRLRIPGLGLPSGGGH